jgi:putative heme-binding domain-containing protein
MHGFLLVLWGSVLALSAMPARGQETADDSGLAALVEVLGQVDDTAVQLDVLQGMHDALRGRKQVKPPRAWSAVYDKLVASRAGEVREKARLLALIFGDARAIESLRATVADRSQQPDTRRAALTALVEAGTPKLGPFLHRLLDDKPLRAAAISSLAAYDDEATPGEILRRYSSLAEDEKPEAVATLASRVSYGLALLSAVEKKTVPRGDITAHTARQLQAFGNKQLSDRLTQVWGTVRKTSGQKDVLLAKYKALLTPDYLATADLPSGRRLFQKNCGICHRLYGEGGQVGPDLTGSNRKNLDYVLENVLDPSAIINRDYKLTLVLATDGRLISGIVHEQPGGTIAVQTATQRIFLTKDDIERMQPSELSMMPEGALDKLSREEVRNLVGYLKTESQVKLPEEKP